MHNEAKLLVCELDSNKLSNILLNKTGASRQAVTSHAKL